MQNFGIYIHIPFCQKKCKYCDFTSFDNCNVELQKEYIKALIKEIDNSKIENEITTVYIGGGTPSILDAELIEKIVLKLKNKFKITDATEITIEINPGTVNLEKLQKYKKIGINRLSIGLQSTNNRLLETLGRIHKYEDFLKVYNDARNIGFDNINVDLMLGLPTQTLEELQESLKKVIKLNPEHISIYSLILEEGTELNNLVKSGKVEMISEKMERKMYWKTKQILEENKYVHYEISNFAKKGFGSRHNLSCWNQDEYIGFGLSAHSYVNKKRFSNIDILEKYIQNINKNELDKNKILQEDEQNFENQAKEYMMLGLRKIEGVSISEFEQKFRINPLFYFRFEISKLEEEGLIEVDLDNIKLTNKGLDFANIVFEEFI